MTRCALVTLSINPPAWQARTEAIFEAWAEREGWDFCPLRERRIRLNPNWPRRRYAIHLEKFQLAEILPRYDRVLYLDGDILVRPGVPDPFARVPPEAVGAVWDDVDEDAWKRTEELTRLERVLGPLPARPDPRAPHFFNAGVLVLSRAHAGLFASPRGDAKRGRWPDQSLLNYRVRRAGVPVEALDPAFNLLPLHGVRWRDPAQRALAHLVHYASREAKAVLLEDLPGIEAAWGLAAD